MEITEVKVFPIQEEKLKAFVSIVFDHCFIYCRCYSAIYSLS